MAPTKRQRLNRQGAIGNNDDEEEAPVAEPEDLAEQLRRKVNMQKLSKDKRDKVCDTKHKSNHILLENGEDPSPGSNCEKPELYKNLKFTKPTNNKKAISQNS